MVDWYNGREARGAAPPDPGANDQMADEAHVAGGDSGRVDLVELSVVLVATSNNPSIINPDFLTANEIVDKDRELQESPVTTPVFAQVVYKGGLIVRADPERVMFVQSASEVSLSSVICPGTAEAYARAVPHVPYRAVGINPKLHVCLADAERANVATSLDGRGAWWSYKDSEPEIQLKAIYPFSSRRIVVDVLGATRRHPNGQPLPGLLFQANVHRELEQTSSQRRIEALVSIVGNWESDVLDCRTLADKFTSHATRDLT
ncbi:MAG: hypothetical protein OXF93_18285 [Acidobacteria bacterium]|nr:hypothetical protein [Acidobacteriota bacterium]